MATFYLDFDNGDNSRTSVQAQNPATPWKHMRDMPGSSGNAFNYVPVAGDTFLLARGSTWTFTTWFKFSRLGTASAPFTFGAYGTGNKPIISNLFPLTSWTLDSGTLWRASTAASQTHVMRMFVNKEVRGQASGTGTIDRTNANFYYYDSVTGNVYVDSGSTVNTPSDVYGTLEVTRSDGGYITTFYIRNELANPAGYVNVSDIEFQGGGTITVGVSNHSDANTDLSNCTFTDCDVRYFSQTAFNVQSYKTDQSVTDTTFTNCDATTNWQSWENKSVSGNGDGWTLGNNSNNARLINCSANGLRHAALNIVAINTAYTLGSRNHYISGFRSTNPISDYGRGFGITGQEGLVSDCVIKSSIFDGGATQNQFNGIRMKLHGCVIKSIRDNGVSASTGTVHGLVLGTSNFPGPSDAINIEDCEIFNNSIINNAGIGLYLLAKDQENMLVNKFYNNIIMNNGALASVTGHTNYDQLVIDAQSSTTTIGTQDFQNNIIYSDQKTDTISFQDDFAVAAVQHTVASIDAAEASFTNNFSVEPSINNAGVPDPGDTNLYHAGKPASFFTHDAKGHKFKMPPTIGAYEFTSGSAALDREVAI